MATIANLDVNLIANTKKFDDRLKKSGKGLSTFTKVGIAAVAGLTAGFALLRKGVQLLGKVWESTWKRFATIDALAKFSREVGTSIDQLKALQLQAKLTGSSTEALEKGIRRWTKTLGLARMGASTGTVAFRDMGISIESFANTTLVQQMMILADAIQAEGDAAKQAAIANLAFGRGGQELLNFFKDGRDGIDAAANDIERFGAGVSAVDAKKIEDANDQFTRLKAFTEAIWQNLAIGVAPALKTMLDRIVDSESAVASFGVSITATMNGAIGLVGGLTDAWSLLQAHMIGYIALSAQATASARGAIGDKSGQLAHNMAAQGMFAQAAALTKSTQGGGTAGRIRASIASANAPQFGPAVAPGFDAAQDAAGQREGFLTSAKTVGDFAKAAFGGTRDFAKALAGKIGSAIGKAGQRPTMFRRSEPNTLGGGGFTPTPSFGAAALGSQAAVSSIFSGEKRTVEKEIEESREVAKKQLVAQQELLKRAQSGILVLL